MRRLCLVPLLSWFACGPQASTPDAGDSCQGAAKSPQNLLTNPGFDCAEPTAWQGIYGTFETVSGGRSGNAGKLTVGAAGGRFALRAPAVLDGLGQSYCVRAWVHGTAPIVRTVLLADNGGGGTEARFAEPLTSDWKYTPPSSGLELAVPPGSKLQLFFEVDSVAGSPTKANVGDVVFVDDVDVWVSTDRCRESR